MKKIFTLCLILSFFLSAAQAAERPLLKEIATFDPEIEVGQIGDSIGRFTDLSEGWLISDKTGFAVMAYNRKYNQTLGAKLYVFNSDGSIRWTYPDKKNEFLTQAYDFVKTGDDNFVLSGSSRELIWLNPEGQPFSPPKPKNLFASAKDQSDDGFLRISIAQDKQTIILPERNGKIHFLKQGAHSAIKIRCKFEKWYTQNTCFFNDTIKSRNDGALAIHEDGRILIMKQDGTLLKTIQFQGIFNSSVNVSEDGSAFVIAVPGWTDRSQVLIVTPKGIERYQVPLAEVYRASQSKEGAIVYTGKKLKPNGEFDVALGIIEKGERESKVTMLPDTRSSKELNTLYTNPTFDKSGRIFASGLDGRLYAFDSRGLLLEYLDRSGESRTSPVVMTDGTIVFLSNGSLHSSSYIGFFQILPNPLLKEEPGYGSRTSNPKVHSARDL